MDECVTKQKSAARFRQCACQTSNTASPWARDGCTGVEASEQVSSLSGISLVQIQQRSNLLMTLKSEREPTEEDRLKLQMTPGRLEQQGSYRQYGNSAAANVKSYWGEEINVHLFLFAEHISITCSIMKKIKKVIVPHLVQ